MHQNTIAVFSQSAYFLNHVELLMPPQLVVNVAEGVQSTLNSCIMKMFSYAFLKAEGRLLFRADDIILQVIYNQDAFYIAEQLKKQG